MKNYCTSTMNRFLIMITFINIVRGMLLESEFIISFFKQKYIQHILVFACWEESDIFKYYQNIFNSGMRTSYISIQDNLDMDKIFKITSYKVGIILDLDCSHSQAIFDQFTEHKFPFNESYHWLSVTSKQEVPQEIFDELPLTIESELTVALIENSTYVLYDVYNHAYDHGGELNITSIGSWDKDYGLKNHLMQFKYLRRQDFHGIILNIAIVLLHPPKSDLNTYLNTPVDVHLDTWSRYHYQLLLVLRDMFNFKINLMQLNTWGYLQDDGTYNGVLGEMVKGSVDISAAPFQYLKDRMDVCEYTVETYVARPYYIFRHPKANNLRNPFLKPFAENIWWLALCVAITCLMLLLLSIKIKDHYQSNEDDIHQPHSTTETALITIAAVSQQGSSTWPYLLSGRIVFSTLFFWALLMFQFYSASIVGSLLSSSPKFIKDLWDLADSDLKVGSEDTPYGRNIFKRSTDPATVNLYKKKYNQKVPCWLNADEGMELVRDGGQALFIDTATAYKIIEDTFTETQICELSEVELLKPPALSMTTSRHSPYKKMVIYGLRKINEVGVVNRLTSVYTQRRPRCPDKFRAKPVPVEFKEFSPAVFLIFGGFILAGCIVLAESYYDRRKNMVHVLSNEQSSERPESPMTSDNVSLEA